MKPGFLKALVTLANIVFLFVLFGTVPNLLVMVFIQQPHNRIIGWTICSIAAGIAAMWIGLHSPPPRPPVSIDQPGQDQEKT